MLARVVIPVLDRVYTVTFPASGKHANHYSTDLETI